MKRPAESSPTLGFQPVAQRAVLNAQGWGRTTVTSGDLIVAIFDEPDSRAVWLPGRQNVTRQRRGGPYCSRDHQRKRRAAARVIAV
jgi:hypothetical protein